MTVLSRKPSLEVAATTLATNSSGGRDELEKVHGVRESAGQTSRSRVTYLRRYCPDTQTRHTAEYRLLDLDH